MNNSDVGILLGSIVTRMNHQQERMNSVIDALVVPISKIKDLEAKATEAPTEALEEAKQILDEVKEVYRNNNIQPCDLECGTVSDLAEMVTILESQQKKMRTIIDAFAISEFTKLQDESEEHQRNEGPHKKTKHGQDRSWDFLSLEDQLRERVTLSLEDQRRVTRRLKGNRILMKNAKEIHSKTTEVREGESFEDYMARVEGNSGK